MADTQSKIEKRREEARKRQELNRKRENAKIKHSSVVKIKVIAVVVAVVLLLGAIIMPSVGVTKRWITAVTIGDTDICTAEYSYYYRTAFENYCNTMNSYLGYVNIDTSKSLDKQQMSETQTYADYFSEQAIQRLTDTVIWAKAAKAEGFELTEEDKESIDNQLAQIEALSNGSNIRTDSYLARLYGTGFNRSLFKESAERELLANSFKEAKRASFEYTEQDKDTYYNENEDTFKKVDIRIESFGTVAASEESEGITAEQAKQYAEEFAAGVKSEQDFVDAALARAEKDLQEGETATDDTLASGVNYEGVKAVDVNVADWAFSDSVKVGDVEVIESSDGQSFYVVYMVSTKAKDTTKTVDVRHILVKVDNTSDTSAKTAAKEKADSLMEQWKTNGSTEEAFAALATENTDDGGSKDTGGLYEAVKPGQMVDTFDAWCFDASRKAGDVEVIESQYGYHVMYFVGENDTEVWELEVEEAMRQADYTAYEAEISEGMEAETHWLGLLLRNEPI